MNLFAILLAAAMATAAPHAHSMMHSNAMHGGAMHGKAMHAKTKMTHGHMMAKPTPKP